LSKIGAARSPLVGICGVAIGKFNVIAGIIRESIGDGSWEGERDDNGVTSEAGTETVVDARSNGERLKGVNGERSPDLE
jgi:hypothetical protein